MAARSEKGIRPCRRCRRRRRAQQWKVGDLVLAKMKGFPAWPAVVRHPSSLTISSSSYAFKLGFSCSMPEPLGTVKTRLNLNFPSLYGETYCCILAWQPTISF
uniref:PWWP domain-containing protein n=1 Tax=Ananas comosus var. bracteatus TaxID=296719 RepID=A0A6V7PSN4_ANACO|nr:unnamed protein product [Ananas comosus var. bracteatus]